ncbi:hypothetical protein DL767_008716 [Monosporascus sp. MG133]|nr:hypothetical protein DL767_008716 [Monosporascus sp. MG133]
MAEQDVTMGGTGDMGLMVTHTKASSSGRSREGTKDSTPLPQIVSDIIRPVEQNSPMIPSQAREQGPQQASSLVMRGVGQNTASQTQTTHAPSRTRIEVLIRSPSGASRHSPISKMKGKTTATSSREQRVVKPQPQKMSDRAAAAHAFVQQKIEGQSPQPTPRGRPKGRKAGTAYSEARGGQPSPGGGGGSEAKKKSAPGAGTGAGESKRRGRPARAPEPTARERYLQSQPTYTRFLCEWREEQHQHEHEHGKEAPRTCPAELQNLETLRRHVHLVHGDADPPVCRWNKCAARVPPVQFADDDAFQEHMQREHYRSFAWHVGDGVQNKGIETLKQKLDSDEPPAYLFKDGVQVTPSVRNQVLEDHQRARERRRKLRQLLIQKDENAPDEEEYMLQTLGLAQAQQQDGSWFS